ncbi:MAG: J domain-containing protein [Deltaproteobacteria bacterium]|nr:J domain-containing protein [Deltaproteobacteria bacterium]
MFTEIGRLRDSTLGDLLGACIRARLDGSLVLDDGAGVRRIHLRRGEVWAVEGEPPRFGALVVAAGALSEGELEAEIHRDRGERRIGQKLVLARRISSATRDALLRAQRAARLDALFGIEDCEVRWCAPSPLPIGAAELPPLPPSRVLAGRPRRRARAPMETERRAALAALDLPADASRGDIRSRYRSLVIDLHPDRGGAREHRLREVLSAWRTLSSTAP